MSLKTPGVPNKLDQKGICYSHQGSTLGRGEKGQLLLIRPPAAFWHPVASSAGRWAVRSGSRMLAPCVGNEADLVLENLVPSE